MRIAVYAVAALIIVLLVALLIMNKGAFTQWYYAKKLEHAGVKLFREGVPERSVNKQRGSGEFIHSGGNEIGCAK